MLPSVWIPYQGDGQRRRLRRLVCECWYRVLEVGAEETPDSEMEEVGTHGVRATGSGRVTGNMGLLALEGSLYPR